MQEAGTGSKTPIPTAEADPCVAMSSAADFGTQFSLLPHFMTSRNIFSQVFQLSSNSVQSILKNSVFNPTELSSFLGYGTLHHWTVPSVVHALCLVVQFNSKFVSSPFRNWKNAVGTSHGI